MRQNVNRRWIGTTVHSADAADDVFSIVLRILDEHVEVPLLPKGLANRVDELVFGFVAAAPSILRHELAVGKSHLRIFVDHPRIRMARQVVEIKVVLLDVLAMVPFAIRKPVQPLLEDRIALVPQRQRETQMLFAIAETGQPVLVPPVRPAPCVVVREVLPGVAIGTVVLANGAPRPLGDVGAPALPVRQALRLFDQTAMLGRRPFARAHITLRSSFRWRGASPVMTRQRGPRGRTQRCRKAWLVAAADRSASRRPATACLAWRGSQRLPRGSAYGRRRRRPGAQAPDSRGMRPEMPRP